LTTATTSSKFPFLKMSDGVSALKGLAFGAVAAAAICLAAWLSPLAAADRPTLALLAVTFSLPLGCMIARRPADPRAAGAIGLGAIAAGLGLALVTLFEPALFVRTGSWCIAAALLGASLGSLRVAGVVATCFWLFLSGLPFFYERLPLDLEGWALQGCPWLGFSSDAFGGDPLRRPLIYMGHWSELTGASGFGTLRPSTLWLAAVPAFAALIVSAGGRASEKAEGSAELDRPGA
jgi:hypothetical protein